MYNINVWKIWHEEIKSDKNGVRFIFVKYHYLVKRLFKCFIWQRNVYEAAIVNICESQVLIDTLF